MRESGRVLAINPLAESPAPALACQQQWGVPVFSLGYVLIMAGLAFGGAVTVVGFGGLLVTWFHRSLGSPLPLPTLHNAFERRLYVMVGIAGIIVWGSAFVCSLNFTP